MFTAFAIFGIAFAFYFLIGVMFTGTLYAINYEDIREDFRKDPAIAVVLIVAWPVIVWHLIKD